jgi:transcriptional regulator with XRE-family HTH domain
MDYRNFGLEIMVFRKRKRLNQAAFADMAEISRNYISMIERGEATNLSVDVLVKLAWAMQADPCSLLKMLLTARPGERER